MLGEGSSILTYYQKALLSFLAECAYQSVVELYEKHNVKTLIKWRRLIKKIDVNFEIGSFYESMWDFSFSNDKCNKTERPFLEIKPSCYPILRELVEFGKISIKRLEKDEFTYSIGAAFNKTIHISLLEQFLFNYTQFSLDYPIPINIRDVLCTNGLVNTIFNGVETWFYSENFDEKTNTLVSSISIHEAEGLFFTGGLELLLLVINFTKLSIYEIPVFYQGRKIGK